MTTKTLEVEHLYVLADALQMELSIDKNEKIRGEVVCSAQIPLIGLKMNQKPKITCSKVVGKANAGGPDIAVIVHVQGELYMCVVHERSLTQVRTMLIDQTRTVDDVSRLFETYQKNGLGSLLNLLRKAAVGEYLRNEFSDQWVNMPLAA